MVTCLLNQCGLPLVTNKISKLIIQFGRVHYSPTTYQVATLPISFGNENYTLCTQTLAIFSTKAEGNSVVSTLRANNFDYLIGNINEDSLLFLAIGT